MKALIVEDEAMIALLMADQLETLGWTTVMVADGTRALSALAAQYFDLAIVDLGLPDNSGAGLIHSMQKMAPRMRLLVCTGYSTEIAVAQGVPADIQILEKPFREFEFLAAVHTATSGIGSRLHDPE